MIAASEPLEFIPHGRRIVAKHPASAAPSTSTIGHILPESSLLHKFRNVAITEDRDDLTFMGKNANPEEPLKEWWCVRCVSAKENHEVAYDQTDEQWQDIKIDESPLMFRLKNDLNTSLKSEILSGCVRSRNLPVSSRIGSNDSSDMSKKFKLINSSTKRKHISKMTDQTVKTDCYYEEELYLKGKTVVWSKGLLSSPSTVLTDIESRDTIACYTCDSPIKHALFCNFYVSLNDRKMFEALKIMKGEFKEKINIKENFEHYTKRLASICVVDTTSLRVFTSKGEDFITSLQFQVKNVWSTKYGILLEKDAMSLNRNTLLPMSYQAFTHDHIAFANRSHSNVGSNTSNKSNADSCSELDPDLQLPTCFSLSHPLDEMAPVLMKSSLGSLQYFNDGNVSIVFLSESPSICLTYDSKAGLHSLWAIRKATSDECTSVCSNTTTSIFGQSGNFPFSNNLTNSSNIAHKAMANSMIRNAGSWLAGVSSPHTSKPGSSSNSRSNSKLNSPLAGAFSRQGMSPHSSIGQASNSSMLAHTHQPAPNPMPIYPDICFDYLWTENHGILKESSLHHNAASKVFLHTDQVGQDFLCFLVSCGTLKQLQIVRLQKSHTTFSSKNKYKLIVGVMTTVSAVDAISLDTLNMIALIDISGNIILYSGTCVIGKVHVGGVLAGLITSPYNKMQNFSSPFPRRSSLLPTLRATDISIMDDPLLHLLSPVPRHGPHASTSENMDSSSIALQGLRDAIGNRLTLEYNKGSLYRISLPELASSSLVHRCLEALKGCLQKDIAMQVIAKWYGVRNAPGSQDLCLDQEWSMFVSLLFSLLGYNVDKLTLLKQPESLLANVEVAVKKQRTSNDGTLDDWDYLMNSKHHGLIGDSLASMLRLKMDYKLAGMGDLNAAQRLNIEVYKRNMRTISSEYATEEDQNVQINYNALLFPYILNILYCLHLVYEEMKLSVYLYDNLEPLSQFLHQISVDLRLDRYVCHYWKDFPNACSLDTDKNRSQMSDSDLKRLSQPSYFCLDPPNIFEHLHAILKRDEGIGCFPYLIDINNISRDLVEVIGLLACGYPGAVQQIVQQRNEGINASSTPRPRDIYTDADFKNIDHSTVLMLCERGYTLRDIENLPPAISILIFNTIIRCKDNPPTDWPLEAYTLVMREDLATQMELTAEQDSEENAESYESETQQKETAFTLCSVPLPSKSAPVGKNEKEYNTGLEHLNTNVLRLRFPDDLRMTEVCNLLQSSIPVSINLTQRSDVSDHEFIEEQEKHLHALCTRTMALPIARGMLSLRSVLCPVLEAWRAPHVCTSGRGPPPRRAAVELPHSAPDVQPHCTAWPAFHNGVAAGLALVPQHGTIDSTWVVYNKPKVKVEHPTEHAGLLMALGLNGHLKDMAFMHIYDYLVKCHEKTSVGLLLGIAATYRGTMDVSATKMMGIHLEALLPPTSIELDIPQNIQVAALLGVGLLYQGTMHTHIAEVLLSEIGRPPGPEMENSVEREGYALAAGLGLGFVCLGAYETAPQHITSMLRHYILGGTKKPLTGAQKEKYKQPSFQIREGSAVNLDVTAPGSTLALGLLYLRSGRTAVADWLAPPKTHPLLDSVRPDLLLLRIIARGLILWDSIEPFEEWVEAQVPASIKPHCFVKPTEDHIDYEAMNQAYCNIVAGACFCIGLRYAGTANEDASETLLDYVKQFINMSTKVIGELAGRSTIETCLNVIMISAGMVLAGTGDIRLMRAVRRLRSCVGSSTAPPVPPGTASPVAPALTHGSHAAVHCALGLLFLGAGRCTLSTSREAVAALIAAFFPKFPTHSNDNRYHLQAFRHLYVLATEPRLIIPRDIKTGNLCYANIQVVTLDKGEVLEMKAPCMLPELDNLKEVRINDSRYWPIVFQRDRNWDQLKTFLKYSWCIDIKQRAGYLSYLEDPQRFLSLLAETLTEEKSSTWSATYSNIFAFSSDQLVVNFTNHYLVKANQARAESVNRDGNGEDAKNNGSKIQKVCLSCFFLGDRKFKTLRDASSWYMDRSKYTGNSSAGDSSRMKQSDGCSCDQNTALENECVQLLSVLTYECVIRDTMCIMPMWITVVKELLNLPTKPNAYHIWQIKLLKAFTENHNLKFTTRNVAEQFKDIKEPLISNEFSLSMQQKASNLMTCWEPELNLALKRYLGFKMNQWDGLDVQLAAKLAAFVTYYDIPSNIFKGESQVTSLNYLQFLMELEKFHFDATTTNIIWKLFR